MSSYNGNGNGNGSRNGKQTRGERTAGTYDRRSSLLFALDDGKQKAAPPPPPPAVPIVDPRRLVWSPSALIRAGAPDFKIVTPKQSIPRNSIVMITAIDGDYAQVKDVSGKALGWTKRDNLRLLYKDRSALAATAVAPTTAIVVKPTWSADRRNIAAAYNRLGGLMEATAKESGAEVASILAVWLVESGGGPKPAKMNIRIELHVLFDEWGSANEKVFDEHFAFGTRAPFNGPKCPTKSSCHRYRAKKTDPWLYPHTEGTTEDEYKMLEVIKPLAGDLAYSCMSMGGAQVMGNQHEKLGYDTAKAMFDAFEASEAVQLFGFFDEIQSTKALNHFVAKDFKKFARIYNGSGKVDEYAKKIKDAFDEATAILPKPAAAPAPKPVAPAANPAAPAPAPVKAKSLGTDEETETQSNAFSEALDDRKRPAAPSVSWAADADSIDYSHLGVPFDATPFELTPAHLATLGTLNAFDVAGAEELVLFALRGCALSDGDETEWVDKVQLKEAVPDHEYDRCVIGVWNRTSKKLRAFTGSTVPWRKAVRDQFTKKRKANLLPTGWYQYAVGHHNSGKLLIAGAFRQQGKVVCLRSFDDLTYTTRDAWDVGTPADNIHCTRHTDNGFSSYGCLTVKGTYDVPPANTHHGPWANFRASAGLRADSKDPEGSKTFHLMLLTGREARCVAVLANPSQLRRLRFGSSGSDVKALQDALAKAGVYKDTADSQMGAGTVKALIDWQRARDASKPAADGILTSAQALSLGVSLSSGAAAAKAQELVGALGGDAGTKFVNCAVVPKAKEGLNVALRWNRLPAKGEMVDRLIHFHGFQYEGQDFPIEDVLDRSGIFGKLKGTWPGPERARPLLAIAPRGRKGKKPTHKMDPYYFDEVAAENALAELEKCGTDWFEKNALDDNLRPLQQSKRLIMTAHSGGGVYLDAAVAQAGRNLAGIHLFDALYQNVTHVLDWAKTQIDVDFDMLKPEPRNRWELCMITLGHAARVVFNPDHSYESNTCWLARRIEDKLATLTDPARRDFLSRYYRVEKTGIPHMDIPITYGPKLLADPGATFDPPLVHVDIPYCDKVEGVKTPAKAKSLSYAASTGFQSIWQ